jgi:NADH-quinone oxidoreductase subunit N
MDIMAHVPEIWIGLMASVILLMGRTAGCGYVLSQITLGGTMLSLVFETDPVICVMKNLMCFLGIFALMYAHHELQAQSPKRLLKEYFVFSLFSLLGMMILCSATDFLIVYLGLELSVLPLYVLIAWSKEEPEGMEAALKYFLMNVIASGVFLYGISLLYGSIGSFEFADLRLLLQPSVMALSGMVFVLVGLGFKLGAVPFHMWVPDVYQGAPWAVTLWIGVIAKIAGVTLMVRLLHTGFVDLWLSHWQPLLGGIGILSIAFGNLVAIAQTNIRRLLAYSAIAQVGWMLLGGLAFPTSAGVSSVMTYLMIDVFIALGIFGILILLRNAQIRIEKITDLSGLGRTQPWVASMLLLLCFSFAGVPPTIGFYAKFLIAEALMMTEHTVWVVAAVVLSVLGLYYYLRLVKIMFFDNPNVSAPLAITKISGSGLLLTSLHGLAVLVLGIFPSWLTLMWPIKY